MALVEVLGEALAVWIREATGQYMTVVQPDSSHHIMAREEVFSHVPNCTVYEHLFVVV